MALTTISLEIPKMHLGLYRKSTQHWMDGGTIVFNVADYGSTYLDGDGSYVAPEDGIYRFDFAASYGIGYTGTAQLYIKVGSVYRAYSDAYEYTVANSFAVGRMTFECYVPKNTKVYAGIFWSGTAANVTTGAYTYLAAQLVQAGSADADVVDTTGPVISGYNVTGMADRGDGTFGMQITWTTSEPATSQVSWTQDGGTSTYDTVLDDTLVTSHLVNIGPDYPVAGDIDVTVKSADASGNLTTQTEPTATVA